MRRALLLALVALPLMAASAAAQTNNYDFTVGPQGWSASGSGAAVWSWGSTGAGGNGWFTNGQASVNTTFLLSPVLAVGANGLVTGSFVHRFQLESGFDGGQLQFSVNGGAFNTVPQDHVFGTTYNATISSSFSSSIGGQRAFSGTSTGFATPAFVTSTFTLGTGSSPFSTGSDFAFTSGDTVQLRFLGAWDSSVDAGDPNWHIQSASITLPAAVPEPTTLALGALGMAGAMTIYRKRRSKRLAFRKAK